MKLVFLIYIRLEKIIEIIDLNLDKQIKELQGFKK